MLEKWLLGFLKAWGGAIAAGLLVYTQTSDWKAAVGSALVAGGVVAGTPNDLSRKVKEDVAKATGQDFMVDTEPVDFFDENDDVPQGADDVDLDDDDEDGR